MHESFHDRERQFEAKFAYDQEILFKVRAHRDRLFADWAADQLGEDGSPGYADALIAFAFGRKPEDLIGKVMNDLHDHGVGTADVKIKRAFEMCTERARDEVMNDISSKKP